jgi:hypothetical protein
MNDFSDERRDTRWQLRRVRFQDRRDDVRPRFAGERTRAAQQLVEEGAKRENVRTTVDLARTDLLRGHVPERAGDDPDVFR